MKVRIEDLKSYNIYQYLPPLLQNLKAGEKYCFYYGTDYDYAKIIVIKDFIAINLNASLYKDVYDIVKGYKNADVFLAYFTNEIETRDGLFYLFLRKYVPENILNDFYAICNDTDTRNEIIVSNNASIQILSRENFISALAYFTHSDKINLIGSIYDTVDSYLLNKNKKSLYGSHIKRVVQLVKHDAGILLDEQGSVRYMVVGKNAELNKNQKDNLDKANLLLRSLYKVEDIYTQTGWYFSKEDGYWKSNISDFDARLDETKMIEVNGIKFYRPTSCPISDIDLATNIHNPDYLISNGYNGKLSDVLIHEKLYQAYPELIDYPLIFTYQGQNIFYKSDSYGGFININGNPNKNNILSILLHETQHAIQTIENFATGGNQTLAQFVIAMGGDKIRKTFALINNFYKFLNLRQNDDFFIRFRDAIQSIKVNTQSQSLYKEELKKMMLNFQVYTSNIKSISFYLFMLITETEVFNEGRIIEFLDSEYGFEMYDLLENLKDSVDARKKVEKTLKDEGLSNEDIEIYSFNTYQNLLGEQEARGTQHGMKIPANLSNYFVYNRWENSPTKSIAVIGGNYMVIDTAKIYGACEIGYDGRYILHFNKDMSSEPFLHELGHIVHDILVDEGFGDSIKEEYNSSLTSDTYEEYFVNVFLGYLFENYNNSFIKEDLLLNTSKKSNKSIFTMLSNIFNPLPSDTYIVKSFIEELLNLVD
jgi:hypothetical protein